MRKRKSHVGLKGTEIQMQAAAPPVILLVEDHPSDILIFNQALASLDLQLRVIVVNDGQAAIQYLTGAKPFADRSAFPLPDLVFLDLKLPIFDGFHVLEWIRTEPKLRTLAVVILAGSNAIQDINRAYAFGANSFITKSPSLPKLAADLKLALNNWLGKSYPKPVPDMVNKPPPEQAQAA